MTPREQQGRRAPVWVTVAILGVTPALLAVPAPQSLGRQFLESYEHGNPVSVTAGDEHSLIADLKRVAGAWISSAPGKKEARRRMVALASLELAPEVAGSERGELLEWACDIVRNGATGDFERQWMIAAASLLGELPFVMLIDTAKVHIRHARAAFPSDPSLRLAEVLTRPEAVTVANRPGVDERRLARAPWQGQLVSSPRRINIRQTTESLESLESSPGVGPEAAIRRGLIDFLRGEAELGLDRFRLAAKKTDDPYLQNLASLMHGLVLERTGDSAGAVGAYRSAFAALPTTTAATALAVALFLSGARPEAASVLDAAYRTRSPLDPWHDPAGLGRHFSGALNNLRQMAGMPLAGSNGTPPVRAPVPATIQAPPERRQALVPDRSPAAPVGAAQFRSVTTSVMVDVAVYDGKVPVLGLSPEDFEVLDNGVPQTITATSIDRVPLDVSIVLELNDPDQASVQGVQWQPAQAIRDAMRTGGLMKPGDRIRILLAMAEGPIQALALQQASEVVERGVHVSRTSPHRLATSTLFDTVAAALVTQQPADRRSLVLVLTDGIDGASIVTPERLVAVARQCDSVVYLARRLTFGEQFRQRNPKSTSEGPELNRMLTPIPPTVIEGVVEATGGLLRHPAATESMVSFFEQVIDDFRQRYLFHYTPTGVSSGGWHTVTVRLKNPGRYRIAARRGYFGG